MRTWLLWFPCSASMDCAGDPVLCWFQMGSMLVPTGFHGGAPDREAGLARGSEGGGDLVGRWPLNRACNGEKEQSLTVHFRQSVHC